MSAEVNTLNKNLDSALDTLAKRHAELLKAWSEIKKLKEFVRSLKENIDDIQAANLVAENAVLRGRINDIYEQTQRKFKTLEKPTESSAFQ